MFQNHLLDSATVEEMLNCSHLKFNLDTANSLMKYGSASNIIIEFISEITRTRSNLCENFLDAAIVTFNGERNLHPSFPEAELPTSLLHSSIESLYSIPGARSPVSSKPISCSKQYSN